MVFQRNENWPNTSYNSKINNVVTEFFIPALKNSTTYRRIGGLFSSNSFALCARGIKELIANEGKMELVVSPILSKDDASVMKNASNEEFENIVTNIFNKEFDSIESKFEKDHVAALLYLLKNEYLEIRINIPKDVNGDFVDLDTIIEHNTFSEKRGIFQDRDGNIISFRGPVNENKDSWERGTFSITVDVSWTKGQLEHIHDDITIFEKVWNSTDTYKLPEITKDSITKYVPTKDEIILEKYDVPPWAFLHDGRKLWDNQIRAVNAWLENRHKGIFTIATAGGKTLAALSASKQTPHNVLILIVVHGLELVNQWEKEIQSFDPNANLTICDSNHPWREKLSFVVSQFFKNVNNIHSDTRFYVLANDSTACNDGEDPKGFLKFFEHVDPKKLMFIADEAHHLGSPLNQKIFKIQSYYRVALSATFVRQWDDEGTQEIINYFGDELSDAKYTVKNGIDDGRLCKYFYHPFFATLDQDEFDEYNEKTIDIGIKLNEIRNVQDNHMAQKELTTLTNLRADIIKKANDKKKAYEEIIKSIPNLPYIVFLDDTNQLEEFRDIHNHTIDQINDNNEKKNKKRYFYF